MNDSLVIKPAPSWADRVDRSSGPHACWPWTGSLTTRGYGHAEVLAAAIGDKPEPEPSPPAGAVALPVPKPEPEADDLFSREPRRDVFG